MKLLRIQVFMMIAMALLATVVSAVSQVDVYEFDSPAQQSRYKALIEEFRCPKCMNTNIAGSDAPIAQDLRRTVHRLVVVEDYTDQEVRDFLQQRYGDFVLYNPPFNARTGVIWLLPVVLGCVGLAVLIGLLMRARRRAPLALDSAQQARLKTLLEED